MWITTVLIVTTGFCAIFVPPKMRVCAKIVLQNHAHAWFCGAKIAQTAVAKLTHIANHEDTYTEHVQNTEHALVTRWIKDITLLPTRKYYVHTYTYMYFLWRKLTLFHSHSCHSLKQNPKGGLAEPGRAEGDRSWWGWRQTRTILCVWRKLQQE